MGPASLTTLDAALAGVTALGFDTPPFIYFIERHPAHLLLLRELFRRVDGGALAGYGSVVTLTEVLTKPKAAGDVAMQNEYRSVLLGSRHFHLVSIDAAIAENAADLRARFRLRTPDALQLATALARGCQAFLTNDAGLNRVTGIRLLVLDDLELQAGRGTPASPDDGPWLF